MQEADHHPDAERQGECGVRDDQGESGVQQVELRENDVKRQDQRDARHHPHHQVEQREGPGAAIPKSGKGIGRQEANYAGQDAGSGRHHECVHQVTSKVRRVQQRRVIGERGCENPGRRHDGHELVGFDAGQGHPGDRADGPQEHCADRDTLDYRVHGVVVHVRSSGAAYVMRARCIWRTKKMLSTKTTAKMMYDTAEPSPMS